MESTELPHFTRIALEAIERYGQHPIRVLRPGRKDPLPGRDGHPIDLLDKGAIYEQGLLTPEANAGVVLGWDGRDGFDNAIVIDIDTKHPGIDPFASLEAATREHGIAYPQTLEVKTASGGFHRVYEHPKGLAITKKIGFLPGIDLLMGKNYIVAAGSVIATGQYEENSGGGTYEFSDDVPVARCPDWMCDGDLVELIWRASKVARSRDGNEAAMFREWSGKTHYPSAGWHNVLMHIWVKNGFGRFLGNGPPIPTFGRGQGQEGHHFPLLSLFGYLRNQSWPSFEKFEQACNIGCGLITFPDHREHNHKDVERLIEDTWAMTSALPQGYSWETEEEQGARLQAQEDAKPLPFPTEVFPSSIQALVSGMAEAHHIPHDFLGVPLLVVASGSVGGVVRARMNETGWVQPLNLYAISVGMPFTGKAEGNAMISRPLRMHQIKLQEQYEEALEDYNREHRVYKLKQSVWESTYKAWWKDTQLPATQQAGVQHPGDAPEEPVKPTQTYLYATHGTSEGVAKAMMHSPKFSLITDELSGLILGLNQYKGGSGSDKSFYIESWKGTQSVSLRVDEARIINVRYPFLNVYGTIQPDVVPILLNPKGWDDGFMDRWLFCYPEVLEVGLPSEVDVESLAGPWAAVVDKLLSLDWADTEAKEPQYLRFDPEAYEYWHDWQEALDDEINAGASLRGPLGKLSQYWMRFAAILHLINWAAPDGEVVNMFYINLKAAQGATVLFDYFRRMANRTYGKVYLDVTGVTPTSVARSCKVCGVSLDGARADAIVCGATCRKRLARAGGVVTPTSVTSVTQEEVG